jgi:hypothetical protein
MTNSLKKLFARVLVSVVIFTGAVACGSDFKAAHEYTYADCKERLSKDIDKAMADPKWKGNKDRPKECANVTDKQAEKLAEDLLAEKLEEAFSDKG